MAVRTFYGTCATASGVSAKEVIISDISLTEDANLELDGFQFKEGDLLTVFFADTNTVSTPSIVIDIPDTNEQISTSIDSGKLIKSLDVTANMENAWAAGETVIFAYTQQSTSDTYYWELIDANHASVETYGDTKLFDDTDFANWIDEPEATQDSEIALTPNTLKKFFNLLRGNQTEDEPVVKPPIGLYWQPTTQGEEQTLGYLSLSNGLDEGNWLEITYPIETKIQEYIGTNPTITHTGQLINNGNGIKPGDETNPDTEPFITRVIPDDLYFNTTRGLYYGIPSSQNDDEQEGESEESDTPTAWPRIILNDTNNYLVLGSNDDTTLAGITINKPTEINGNLNTNGVITSTLPSSAEPPVSSESGIITNGTIKEKNTLLSDRYSPKLQVIKYTDQIGKIEANKVCKRNNSSHLHIDVHQDDWKPIGIVGYNTNYQPPHNTGDALYANIWECYLTTINGVPNIEYSILNLRNQDIYVSIDIYVLYEKVL